MSGTRIKLPSRTFFLSAESPEEKEKALAELRGNHETVLRLYGEFVAALRQETQLD